MKSAALIVAVAALAGCAGVPHGPINFGPLRPSVYYTPSECRKQPDGSWLCNHVRIVPQAIDAKNVK